VGDHTGLTNYERFHFICHVFDVESINLNEQFDFDVVIATGDLEVIAAAMHLASLQYEWVERCHHEGHIEGEAHEVWTAYLINSKRKMIWADSFMRVGSKPPPYPFVN
jgi:3',5'-cyclic AMP phosphodiesterase CpdA